MSTGQNAVKPVALTTADYPRGDAELCGPLENKAAVSDAILDVERVRAAIQPRAHQPAAVFAPRAPGNFVVIASLEQKPPVIRNLPIPPSNVKHSEVPPTRRSNKFVSLRPVPIHRIYALPHVQQGPTWCRVTRINCTTSESLGNNAAVCRGRGCRRWLAQV